MKKSVFVSYRRENDKLIEQVSQLVKFLRDNDLTVVCDQDFPNAPPPEDFLVWMHKAIEEASVVLIVCTAGYKTNMERKDSGGGGRGVVWEGAIISQELYTAKRYNTKFLVIQPDGEPFESIPTILRGFANSLHFPSQQNRILAAIGELFRWQGEGDKVSPSPDMSEPKLKEPRTRRPISWNWTNNSMAVAIAAALLTFLGSYWMWERQRTLMPEFEVARWMKDGSGIELLLYSKNADAQREQPLICHRDGIPSANPVLVQGRISWLFHLTGPLADSLFDGKNVTLSFSFFDGRGIQQKMLTLPDSLRSRKKDGISIKPSPQPTVNPVVKNTHKIRFSGERVQQVAYCLYRGEKYYLNGGVLSLPLLADGEQEKLEIYFTDTSEMWVKSIHKSVERIEL